jgi:UDP-3-O-[3-hydroxymyristoyl] glucosamine N-acyltransferase
MTKTLKEIAETVGAEFRGDPNLQISGIAPLQNAQAGQITFLSNPVYRKYLATTHASVVILTADDAEHCPGAMLINDNPYLCYAKVATLFSNVKPVTPGIHPTAVVGKDCVFGKNVHIGPQVVLGDAVHIGDNTIIGPSCTIGDETKIGNNCRLWARVTIYHQCLLGENIIIHSGVVIGSDGFGMAKDNNGDWIKIPQLGKVVINDNVEIGANTTIDRGALGDTVIGKGVKLDNLIQIGHNVVIGENTAIAGCVGIAGSAKIGKNCLIGGGSGIAGHLTIADNVSLTGMSGVPSSITESGSYSSALGIQKLRAWGRNFVRFTQLDDLAQRLVALERKIKSSLETATAEQKE